ncbi:unnamed protein product [Victoria cruziana]
MSTESDFFGKEFSGFHLRSSRIPARSSLGSFILFILLVNISMLVCSRMQNPQKGFWEGFSTKCFLSDRIYFRDFSSEIEVFCLSEASAMQCKGTTESHSDTMKVISKAFAQTSLLLRDDPSK